MALTKGESGRGEGGAGGAASSQQDTIEESIAAKETLPLPEDAPNPNLGDADTLDAAQAVMCAQERRQPAGPVEVSPEHYEVIGELARGGIGVIRRAHDHRTGRDVAIKELLVPSRRAQLRFEREARITAQLQHPSIVPVYEVGHWPDGSLFYAMKIVAGRPLDEVVSEALDADARLALVPRILPAVEAIAYAHEHGVIHRDLKPANILLGKYGETVVIDWGLAARISSSSEEQVGFITQEGYVIGTPSYMSPEQATGASVDARTDVYALGALLYHALSGQAPYVGKSAEEVLDGLLAGPPMALSERAPSTPPDLVSIVEKAMARCTSDRYADAGELARDLEAFTTGRLVSAYSYTSWELVVRFVRKNRALTAAVVALLLFALVGVGAIVSANRVSERQRLRAEAAERLALVEERTAHERLAHVHWRAAVWRLQRGEHLKAEVLAAGALVEQDEAQAIARRLGDPEPASAASAAGPRGNWATAKALRYASRVRTLEGHEDWLYGLLPSPDGRFLVSTSADRRGVIWDTRNAKAHRVLEGHRGTVFQAALRRDGRQLATSSYDGTVRLWTFPEGEYERALAPPASRLYGLCYAPNGALFIAAPGAITVFDPRSGEQTARIEVPMSTPWQLRCPTDQSWGVLGGAGEEVLLLDLESKSVPRRFVTGGASVRCAALTPDGQKVLAMDRRGVLCRFDRETGAEEQRVDLRSECRALVTSPDGRWIAIGGEEILIVDAATFRLVTRLHGHRLHVAALAFDRAGRALFSGGRDGRVVEWQINDDAAGFAVLTPSTSEVDTVRVSPDGRWLASAGDDPIVRVWELPAAVPARAFEGHREPVRALRFLDNKRLISSGLDQTLRTWDLGREEVAAPIALPSSGDELSVSPDGTQVAIGSKNGDVLLYNLGNGDRHVIEKVHDARAWWVGFEPQGEWLASASFAGEIVVIDPRGGRVTRRWSGHVDRIYDASWRPDGGELTTGDLDGWIRGWDTASGENIREWRVLEGEEVLSLAWSADASRILVTTTAGARVYRPEGTLIFRLDLGGRTRSADWTEDGRIIFAADGRLYVLPYDEEAWSGPPTSMLRDAERASGIRLESLVGVGSP